VSLNGREQEAYDASGLPKITFMDAMKFYFNGNTIEIVYTGPGHTDGDAQVYFRESNVLHTGDMFVRYGLPFIDQPNGGTTSGMIDSLWEIAGLIDDDTIIIPGHGQLAKRSDLLEYRSMLVTIRERLQVAIAQGQSADQVVASDVVEGFAAPGAGTERWVRAAYEEYR
jgi:cyclase